MSNFFKIQKVCKQGDPIASIELIICAQILYLMINKNPVIKGIIFVKEEVKMSKFTDDTTLT